MRFEKGSQIALHVQKKFENCYIYGYSYRRPKKGSKTVLPIQKMFENCYSYNYIIGSEKPRKQLSLFRKGSKTARVTDSYRTMPEKGSKRVTVHSLRLQLQVQLQLHFTVYSYSSPYPVTPQYVPVVPHMCICTGPV